MPVKLMLFLSILILVVFLMHYAFFKSVMHFFAISRPGTRALLHGLMFFLSFSFILAFFLLRWHASPAAIWYYRLTAAWTGFLIHYLTAVVAIWGIFALARVAGLSGGRMAIAAVILLLTTGYSAYTLWGAFHPVVREISIEFDHLPENWENSRIIQLSDLHFGCIHGKTFAERVVAQVNALDPDLVLVTGDLLDGVNGPYAEFIEPLRRLRAKHGIFFVTGNHEHYVGIKKAIGIIEKTGWRILDDEMVSIDGLEIVGIGYPGIRGLEDIANLPDTRPESGAGGHARILLFHTPTNLAKVPEGQADRHFYTYWMPDTSFELNQKMGCDVQLSGHSHHGQIFPLNFATRFLFKRFDYGLNRIGNLQVYTTCGAGTWGPPLRSPIRPEIVLIRPAGK